MCAQITPLLPFSTASVARNPSCLWEVVKKLLNVGVRVANLSKSEAVSEKRDRRQKTARKLPTAKDGASR